MNTTAQPPAAHLLHGELHCPRCGNDVLEAVSDGDDTNFLCQQCWSCWHWDLGYVVPVPSATCAGCYHKEQCLRRPAVKVEPPGTQPG